MLFNLKIAYSASSRSHQQWYIYFFFIVLSHGKLDQSFFFMAGPKSANFLHTSGPKSPRKIIVRVLEKYVRLVALTYASPKVNVTASKLVLEKKDWVLGVWKDYQNNLSFLVIILIITVSIRNFFVYFFIYFLFCLLFFLYSGYGAECYARLINLTRCLVYWDDSSVTQCLVDIIDISRKSGYTVWLVINLVRRLC